MKLLFETPVERSFEEIRDRFSKELFLYLSPDVIPFKLKRFDGLKTGDEIHIDLGPRLFSQEWISVITDEKTDNAGWSFVDEGKVLRWPISLWKHHHRVDKLETSRSRIVDDIYFECSPRFLGPLVKPLLWKVFALRPGRYKKYFEE